MTGLEQSAILVSYSASTWGGTAPCEAARLDIQEKRGNADGTTRTHVYLVDEAEIKKNESAFNAAYLFYRANTIPWETKRGGARLLPGANYQRFKAGIETLTAAAQDRADEFSANYPRLKGEYEAKLNGLAATIDPKYYPRPEDMRNQFNITVSYSPLPLSPESLTLKFLGRDEFDRLRAQIAGAWEKQEAAAMGDLYKRLAQTVAHMATTLANPDKVFRDSMVDNLTELADLIPALNFKNDPELAELAEIARGKLVIDPVILRQDLIVRGQIAGEAGALLAKITGAGARYIDLT